MQKDIYLLCFTEQAQPRLDREVLLSPRLVKSPARKGKVTRCGECHTCRNKHLKKVWHSHSWRSHCAKRSACVACMICASKVQKDTLVDQRSVQCSKIPFQNAPGVFAEAKPCESMSLHPFGQSPLSRMSSTRQCDGACCPHISTWILLACVC